MAEKIFWFECEICGNGTNFPTLKDFVDGEFKCYSCENNTFKIVSEDTTAAVGKYILIEEG